MRTTHGLTASVGDGPLVQCHIAVETAHPMVAIIMDRLHRLDRLHHQSMSTKVLPHRHQLHTLRQSTLSSAHQSPATHLPLVLKSQQDHHHIKAMDHIMGQDPVADGAEDAVAGVAADVEDPTAFLWATVRHHS